MNISELTIGQGRVNVEGIIKSIGNTRSFTKYGKQLTVANAILSDDSGSITLTLWNDDVTRFKEGDKIKVLNGWVGEFQGEKQLTSGKYGSIEKLDAGDNQEKIHEEIDGQDEQNETSDETRESEDTEESVY